MLYLFFGILVLISAFTDIMLTVLMTLKGISFYREILLAKISILGLTSSLLLIEFYNLNLLTISYWHGNSMLILLVLSTFSFVLISIKLILNNKIKKLLSTLFIIISFSVFIVSIYLPENISLAIVSSFFLIGTYCYLFTFLKHYPTITKSICYRKRLNDIVFIFFMPLIILYNNVGSNSFFIPHTTFFFIILYFLKNIFTINEVIIFLSRYEYSKSNATEFTTIHQSTTFSENESEIINLILLGKSNTEIAKSLYKSPSTIKKSIKSIYMKYEIENKMDLLFFVERNNIIVE